MEVDGEEHDILNSLIAKQMDNKISKAKAKDKKGKDKKLFGQRKNPSAGARKNWSEWSKRCDRRWERRALSFKEEVEKEFKQRRKRRERALSKKKAPHKT